LERHLDGAGELRDGDRRRPATGGGRAARLLADRGGRVHPVRLSARGGVPAGRRRGPAAPGAVDRARAPGGFLSTVSPPMRTSSSTAAHRRPGGGAGDVVAHPTPAAGTSA